jgi:hypothetical protein
MADELLPDDGDPRRVAGDRDPDLTKTQVGRLALRIEGDMWVAYYAQPGTMDDAVMLGSMRLTIVRESPDHRRRFMDLMCEAVGDQIEQVIGGRPIWGAPVAPESERAGNA